MNRERLVNNSVLKRAKEAVRWPAQAIEAAQSCAPAGPTGSGTRSCRFTRHLVAPELKLALDVRLPVIAHLIIALHPRGLSASLYHSRPRSASGPGRPRKESSASTRSMTSEIGP